MTQKKKCGIITKSDNYGTKIRDRERRTERLQRARKSNRNKNVDQRLHALILHAERYTGKKVSKIAGYNEKYLFALYQWNHRNITYEEESELLAQFIDEADGGHITNVSALKAAYDEKVGHETGSGQIYYVLYRYGWKKKLPRSKHPTSADPETIKASKKLTLESENLKKFPIIPKTCA